MESASVRHGSLESQAERAAGVALFQSGIRFSISDLNTINEPVVDACPESLRDGDSFIRITRQVGKCRART